MDQTRKLLMATHGLSEEQCDTCERAGIRLDALMLLLAKYGGTALEIFLAFLNLLPVAPKGAHKPVKEG